MDAKDITAAEPRSLGCSVALLYNDRRPHCGLGWLTPVEFAQTINPRRDAVRSRNVSAPQTAGANAKLDKTWGQGHADESDEHVAASSMLQE